VTFALALGIVSLVVHAAAMATFLALLARRRTRRASAPAAPRFVSILKPLAGVDDELEENLASFERLVASQHEILFGVASKDDPAWAAAVRFCERCPRARVLLTERDTATNPKVAQLVTLAAAARGELLIINDSNVRVPPTYVSDMTAPIERGAGLVTSLIVGTGEKTFGAALENLQLAAYITPAVVLSACTRTPITVGKSMAMRARDLDAIGGVAAVGEHLAEDHELGRRFREAGHRIELSLGVVENRNVHTSLRQTFERHARWAKMRRAIHPLAFALEPLMAPVVVALAACFAAPGAASATLLVAALLEGTTFALLAVRLLRGAWPPWRFVWVELARPGLLLACWVAAWWSRRVVWRSHAVILGPGTLLTDTRASRGGRQRSRAYA